MKFKLLGIEFYLLYGPEEVGSELEYAGWSFLAALQLGAAVLACANLILLAAFS